MLVFAYEKLSHAITTTEMNVIVICRVKSIYCGGRITRCQCVSLEYWMLLAYSGSIQQLDLTGSISFLLLFATGL